MNMYRHWLLLPHGVSYAGNIQSNLPNLIEEARRIRDYAETVWYDDCGFPHPVCEVAR